jgi:hypothetical protein
MFRQDFLEANLDSLRSKGFLVANNDFAFPETGKAAANPVGALEQLHDQGEAGAQRIQARLRELHARLTTKGSGFDKAVISAENLCNPGFSTAFAPALDLFDVHLIYYVRRQDEWLISAWKQWGIKAGKSLDEFCLEGTKTRYPAFTVALQRWEPFATQVRLKPLHKSALHQGGVTQDFAHAIGLDPLARAATVAPLAARELRVDEVGVDAQARGDSLDEREHRGSVRFAGRAVAEHRG